MKQSLVKVMTALRDHGPLNNKQLKEHGAGGLTGADNAELVAQGLVTTEKAGRILVHTLTPAGEDYLNRPAPELLSPTQILALVVLMAEARELSNNEFARAAGFSLTGKDNEALVKRGLVETDRSARPFVHQLTDKGWKFVRTLHESEVPKEGRSAIRTLFSLMANVGRALERLQISHGEFFKQTQATVTAAPAAGVAPQDVEGAIRAAYAALADPPGEWVGLADVRNRLPGVDRAAVDAALRAMLARPGVRVIPVANTKALQARDRAAAVRIGGEDSHMMAIEPS